MIREKGGILPSSMEACACLEPCNKRIGSKSSGWTSITFPFAGSSSRVWWYSINVHLCASLDSFNIVSLFPQTAKAINMNFFLERRKGEKKREGRTYTNSGLGSSRILMA